MMGLTRRENKRGSMRALRCCCRMAMLPKLSGVGAGGVVFEFIGSGLEERE